MSETLTEPTNDDMPAPAETAPGIHVPRGFRNKNPGNIRHGVDWKGDEPEGVTPNDPEFETYVNARYGIRGIVRILRTYQERYHLQTVREIVSRWAPAVENDTHAYIEAVAGRLGVRPEEPINLFPVVRSPVAQQLATSRLAELVEAIIRHELGKPRPEVIAEAYRVYGDYDGQVPAGLGPERWYPREDILFAIELEREGR